MTNPRTSITLAFVPVWLALGLRHSWYSRAAAYIQKSAYTPPAVKPGQLGPIHLADWQAALILYVALLGGAELDSLSQASVAIAWAIGLVELVSALKLLQDKGVLNSSSIGPASGAATSSAPAAQATPAGPQVAGPAPYPLTNA